MSMWTAAPGGGIGLGIDPMDGPPAILRLRSAPPFPGVAVVAPAVVPEPPMLDPFATERSHVFHLAAVYRAAVTAKMHQPCFVLLRGLDRSPHYRTLANAAQALIKHHIAPAAWAAWTVDVWCRDGDRVQPPPINLVWGAKRITERRGWFGKEAASYMGGRAVFGPIHRSLLTRWYALGFELMMGPDRTPEEVAVVVEKHFPGTAYDDLVRSATVEASKKQAELLARAEALDWVW